jgi:hypothetical protein
MAFRGKLLMKRKGWYIQNVSITFAGRRNSIPKCTAGREEVQL